VKYFPIAIPFGVKNKFVVAIGSSAGGLEPMLSFFDFTAHYLYAACSNVYDY
jgi:hypothetical protein